MTTKPVTRTQDLTGMRIWSSDNQFQIKGLEMLGASPILMEYDEIYDALQQGVLDGVAGPLPAFYSRSFQQICGNLILNEHAFEFITWICGNAFFDALTSEQQRWLRDSGEQAGIYNNSLLDDLEAEAIVAFEAEGVIVIDPSVEVLQGFKDSAQALYSLEESASDWSENLYNIIRESIR